VITLKDTIVINKQLNEAWIKDLHISGLPGGKYIAEVALIPWNRETNQYEDRVNLAEHPDMHFAVDIMQLLDKPKIVKAYSAIVEAVDELHKAVLKEIEDGKKNSP
jgi:hypothetical protein